MNLTKIVTETGESILKAWDAGQPYTKNGEPHTRYWEFSEAAEAVVDELSPEEIDAIARHFSIGQPDSGVSNPNGEAGRRIACALALCKWVEGELTLDYELARTSVDHRRQKECTDRAHRRSLRLQTAL